MSWLTDVANRAENLLNKLDKNASTVLKSSPASKTPSSSKEWIEESSNSPVYFVDERSTVTTQESRSSKKSVLGAKKLKGEAEKSHKAYTNGLFKTDTNAEKQYQSPEERKFEEDKRENSTQNSMNEVDSNNQDWLVPLYEWKSLPEDSSEQNSSTYWKNEYDAQNSELKNVLRQFNQLRKEYLKLKGHEDSQQRLQEKLNIDECDKPELDSVACEVAERAKTEKTAASHSTFEDQSVTEGTQELDKEDKKIHELEVTLEQYRKDKENLSQELDRWKHSFEQLTKSESTLRDSNKVLKMEYDKYKSKAKAILKQKDDFIERFTATTTSTQDPESSSSQESQKVSLNELQALRNEKELLEVEISQTRNSLQTLMDENSKLQTKVQSKCLEVAHSIDQLRMEKEYASSIREENSNLTQELCSVQATLEREKTEKIVLAEKLKRLQEETKEKKANMCPDQNSLDEENKKLKTRIYALSQSLLEKTSLVNSVGSENQLLKLQIERLQLNEQRYLMEATSVPITHDADCNGDGLDIPLISSSPAWKNSKMVHVQKIFSKVDTMCCHFGSILRKRRNFRLGFLIYIICLHLWVFFVLTAFIHVS